MAPVKKLAVNAGATAICGLICGVEEVVGEELDGPVVMVMVVAFPAPAFAPAAFLGAGVYVMALPTVTPSEASCRNGPTTVPPVFGRNAKNSGPAVSPKLAG